MSSSSNKKRTIGEKNLDYRKIFLGVDVKFKLENGKKLIPIGFDNGATTPALKCVFDEVYNNLLIYGSIGRGQGPKGELSTRKYEESKDKVLKFFNLQDTNTHTVIYTKTTTESLNILANILIKNKNDKVLTTRMEHHANDLPWRKNATVEYVDVDELGRIKIEDIENNLRKVHNVKNAVVLPVYKDEKIAYLKGIVELNEKNDLSNIKNGMIIKKELGKYIPSYMIPRNISIISEFPTNINGKIDRKKLMEEI